MKRSILLTLSLTFVMAVQHSGSNSIPIPCCTADQFEVSFGGIVALVEDSIPSALREFFKGAFDFRNRQYGMYVQVKEYGASKIEYQVIQLFNKGKQYVIQDGVCHLMTPIGEPQQCVPDTAVYKTSLSLGNKALLVDDWYQSGDIAQGIEGDVHATKSRYDCTPGLVNFIGTQKATSAKLISSGTYLNFTKGISDPDHWFVPPESCSNATPLTDEGSWPPIQHWRRMRATQMFL